jgi:hypothetical protein
MGPDNPWSPEWRPDPSGDRLRGIKAARRGALLAGLIYLLLAAVVLAVGSVPDDFVPLVASIGLPGIVLLGAGLTPAALGSRIESVFAGIAFAIGAPVASVTSMVIGSAILDVLDEVDDLPAQVLRAGVLTALSLAPLLGAAAAAWVIAVRRFARVGSG